MSTSTAVSQSNELNDDLQTAQKIISQLSEENRRLRDALAQILKKQGGGGIGGGDLEAAQLFSQGSSVIVPRKVELHSDNVNVIDSSTILETANSVRIEQQCLLGNIEETETSDENQYGEISEKSVTSDACRRRSRAPHVCRVCCKTFTHGRPFKRHLLEHGDSSLSCRRCRLTFPNPATLCHHRCRTTHACRHCACRFSNAKLLGRHMRHLHHTAPPPKHFCTECDRGFVKRASLYRHYRGHNSETACVKCGFRASNAAELETHVQTHARISQHTCHKCSATFTRQQQFSRHMKAHAEHDCLQCNVFFSTRRESERHQRLHHDAARTHVGVHACQLCARVFDRPYLLRDHLASHSGRKAYECDICDIALSTSKALAKHCRSARHRLKAGSTPQRTHLCAVCGRSYLSEQAYKRHSLTHTVVNSYACTHCRYRTHDASCFRRHAARHSSQRAHVCGTCNAAFRTKHTLDAHVVHRHTTARAHACTQCRRAFKTSALLRRHAQTHGEDKRHHCTRCDAQFHRVSNLQRHLRSVHGADLGEQCTGQFEEK